MLQDIHETVKDDLDNLSNEVSNNTGNIANNANTIANHTNEIANFASAGSCGFMCWELSGDQGSWSVYANSNQYTRSYILNTSNANGDSLVTELYMANGLYYCRLLGIRNSSSGIIQIRFGNEVIGSTIDMYSATTTLNYSVTRYGNYTGGPGSPGVWVEVNGKNASSSGYRCYLSRLLIHRVS